MFGRETESRKVVLATDAAIDALSELDLDSLSAAERAELVAAMSRLGDRMDATRTRVIERWDTWRDWAVDDARSGQAWLRTKLRRSGPWAGRELRRARKLRHMPATAASFADGAISADHVSVLANARNPRTIEAFERDEDLLVAYAEELRFDHFERAVRYWFEHADPDGADQRASRQLEARSLHHSKTLSGMWATDASWDPMTGSEIHDAIRSESGRLFREEWAHAKERLGREPTLDDLARTPAQRRADATAELIRRGHAAGPTAAVAAPLLNVVVGLDTMVGPICELLDGTVITPAEVVARLSAADIRRVVFDGPDRVLAVGPRARFFRGALRDAIVIRDRECGHACCDIPADRCAIDHVVPYPEGPTTEANGQALCDHHNAAKGRRRGRRRGGNTWYGGGPRGDPEPPDH